jgi:hypothetical protein
MPVYVRLTRNTGASIGCGLLVLLSPFLLAWWFVCGCGLAAYWAVRGTFLAVRWAARWVAAYVEARRGSGPPAAPPPTR